MRYFVDDHLHSLYFVREQWLNLSTGRSGGGWKEFSDLIKKNIRNVPIILSNIGKFVRYLKFCNLELRASNMLDMVATNCGNTLKGLTLSCLQFDKVEMEEFPGIFDNLEKLEIINSSGKSIENFLLSPEYPNLTTLKFTGYGIGLLDDQLMADVLKKFFMRKRSIKKLTYELVHNDNDLFPWIVQNGAEIEEMQIFLRGDVRNLMLVAQIRKLKRLQIDCSGRTSTIALIKELSINTELELLGLYRLEFNEELLDAIGNLANLKVLHLSIVRFTLRTTSMEMLPRKLPKLESLTLTHCYDFPYRNILAALCKMDKFRTIYVWCSDKPDEDTFIQQMVTDFIKGRVHRSFVSGNPLCIYLWKRMFNPVKRFLTKLNFEYENIKILEANYADFFD